jgi:hypothetical protein
MGCTLRNLSFGGMCFRTNRPVKEGEVHQFLLDLQPLGLDQAFVKARIRWVRRIESGEYETGAMFLRSSKGWLGSGDSEE